MVSDVRPPPPPPLVLLLLSLPPQAATPSARAVTRQLDAATERTRKFPSSRKAIPNSPRVYRSAETTRNGPYVDATVSARGCPAGRGPASAPWRPAARRRR